MITPDPEIPPLALLVLARLLPAGEKGATLAQIRKDLDPLIGLSLSASDLAGLMDRAIDDLAASGMLVRLRKGKTDRSTITEAGRRRALDGLGIDEIPERANWGQVLKCYIAARALGLPAPSGKVAKSFSGDPGFRAALLRARFGLPIDPFPTAAQATDALLWKLLGRDSPHKFTLKAAREYLLSRAAGETDELLTEKQSLERLLASELRPRNSKPTELRDAAIRLWADGASEAPPPVDPAPIEAQIAPTAPLPLAEFAHRVVEAARATPGGRFGENRVFIVHVWTALRDDPDLGAMDLDAFKSRLAEANQARHLDLGRADLVEAMDPEDVRASETSHLGAQYHFLRV